MLIGIIILTVYFLAVLLTDLLPGVRHPGLHKEKKSYSTDASFYLSGRKLNSAVLLISMAATNFSAFTVLGLSGAGYRIGYAFYPVMAFGTGFMALGMYLVGSPLGRLGRERNYITPTDFITDRYGSRVFSRLYAAVLVVLTLPYLALQPIAAGILLETSFGLPYRAGVVLCAAVTGLYTSRGGMKAVARTDLLQGVIIVVLAAAAFITTVQWTGGISAAHDLVKLNAPAVLERFGRDGTFGPAVLAGYIVLWFFADPMFPQLNQRLLAAGSTNALEKTVVLYPVVTMILFFLTISVGVVGAGALPGLSGAEADRVWPLMLASSAGRTLLPVFMIAPLAAIMSTLDSQLLSLSSIMTRDIFGKKDAGSRSNRLVTALIAAAGVVIALFPPNNILDFINKSSFLGFAALAPVVFGGLYGKRFNAAGAFASIAAGEGLTLLLGLGVIDFGPVPPVFAVCGASWAALIIGSLVGKPGVISPLPVTALSRSLPTGWMIVFAVLFVLGTDFITYRLVPGLRSGAASDSPLPGWVIYQAGLCILLSLVFVVFFRNRRHGRE